MTNPHPTTEKSAPHIYCCFIHCNEESESTQLSISRRIYNIYWDINVIYVGILFSCKENEVKKFVENWIDLEGRALTEISQS